MSEIIGHIITGAGFALAVSVGAALTLVVPERLRARIALTMLFAAGTLWAVSLALWLGV